MREWDSDNRDLRWRAEERLEAMIASLPVPENAGAILHELRVYQIELEMQNDELLHTQSELEAVRRKYVALFDRAPVGYVTLDGDGIIENANLTAGSLLGIERASLLGLPFSRFVLPADADALHLRLQSLGETSDSQPLELRLQRASGATTADFPARLEVQAVASGESAARSVWITFVDTTECKSAEAPSNGQA